jgi:branched-chain amino acid aminotransferase
MVVIPYQQDSGWGKGTLKPYGPLQLDPAASVLHYGQAIFEGFKAFRQPDGGVAFFRPDANARRFQGSARRMAMPEIPEGLFIAAASVLARHERDWVPSGEGESLYIRPLMIATEPALGVRPARQYLFILFGSPSGSYFTAGIKPVSVWVSEDYVRAAIGGTGDVKCAGNYAASLLAQEQAITHGCEQVVWLDAVERQSVEEMGGMNLFFVFKEGKKTVLATPRLTGTLLPGVTRDSLLRLAPDLGYVAEERTITLEQWKDSVRSGHMTEAFACGTAAVITPIGVLKDRQGDLVIGGGETGPVATHLRQTLLDIQRGRAADQYGWVHRVC